MFARDLFLDMFDAAFSSGDGPGDGPTPPEAGGGAGSNGPPSPNLEKITDFLLGVAGLPGGIPFDYVSAPASETAKKGIENVKRYNDRKKDLLDDILDSRGDVEGGD